MKILKSLQASTSCGLCSEADFVVNCCRHLKWVQLFVAIEPVLITSKALFLDSRKFSSGERKLPEKRPGRNVVKLVLQRIESGV